MGSNPVSFIERPGQMPSKGFGAHMAVANQRPAIEGQVGGKDCEPEAGAIPSRFYSLDVLRGIAALCVVLFHWHLFFFKGTKLAPFDWARLPFFSVLSPAYTFGWRGVDLFFSLSGFIFFWLYADAIHKKHIGWRKFSILRLSRLYPLHLATLLIVLVGQQLIRASTGSYFVVGWNDCYHFVLHLFFASHWGMEHGSSFNNPVWSVSIEILLYGVFFLCCTTGFTRAWQLAAIVAFGVFLSHTKDFNLLGRGLFSFFLGGLSYYVFVKARHCKALVGQWRLLMLTITTAWVLVLLNARCNWLYQVFGGAMMIHHKDAAGYVALILTEYSFAGILFPATIVLLALCETGRGSLGRRFTFLGDISYSSYMLHFPLQLSLAAVIVSSNLDNSLFYRPDVLLVFFVVLISLSLLSHRYFERPIQNILRKRLLSIRVADE